ATGTGKTAAFGLALLARITPRGARPGALVLCPTRELAAQVAHELRRLARPLPHTRVLTLTGGTSVQRERASLEHGVDVIVGTPGRVHDHLVRDRLDLSDIRTLVLDEADRMLEMGFVETVSAIARALPTERQTLLFSATFPDAVRALSTTYQRDALHVTVPAEDVAARITQVLYRVERAERVTALIRILGHHRPESAIVFCNHRETCDEVAGALASSGFAAVALHGGMEQHDRNTVLLLLRNGSLRVVVATDVAARGLDIDDLGAIVNFDLPREPEVFVHRIGRTARAGRSGLAISLADASDARTLDELRQGPLAGVAISSVPSAEAQLPPPPAMMTIAIQGGRQDRLRPGDIVGALTTGVGISGTDIGQIAVNERISFVAVVASMAKRALDGLSAGRIKNKRFRAYLVKPPR
ncbi:MAG TPA: ATP-dependent RNA helicase DbpA, partial [Kofleriaceae bacterium]|nr:ATP-dependent RNA helicase DbpA [Kofleriaceae bacterium]